MRLIGSILRRTVVERRGELARLGQRELFALAASCALSHAASSGNDAIHGQIGVDAKHALMFSPRNLVKTSQARSGPVMVRVLKNQILPRILSNYSSNVPQSELRIISNVPSGLGIRPMKCARKREREAR